MLRVSDFHGHLFRSAWIRCRRLGAEFLSTQSQRERGALRRAMSLQRRLLVYVALALVVSLVLGGAAACWHASRQAQTEMRAVRAVGEQKVYHTLDILSRSDNQQLHLERLITAFNGDRYVRATLVLVTRNDGNLTSEVVATSTLDAPLYEVPDWFLLLLGLAPETVHIPIMVGNVQGIVSIESDPSNEAREIWDEFGDGLLVVGMFCGLIVLLVGWFARRAVVEPLNRVTSALHRIGEGDYVGRVPESGPSELAGLAASFNRMADRLASTEVRNRGLNAQLLTLQEEERGALARDLHDEIGPCLFAINVDAAAIGQLAEENNIPAISARVKLIDEAVGHMQRQVKATLGRLRPAGLAEFGLKQAIEHLIAFWRHHYPDTKFKVSHTVALDGDGFGELIDATLYRVIQEAMSNAVRHGHASSVMIRVALHEQGKEIVASIIDNGGGLMTTNDSSDIGFGLLGMRERVAALGGSLTRGPSEAGSR
jgi:two-component system sensor histidine kinase UhpB